MESEPESESEELESEPESEPCKYFKVESESESESECKGGIGVGAGTIRNRPSLASKEHYHESPRLTFLILSLVKNLCAHKRDVVYSCLRIVDLHRDICMFCKLRI